MKRTTLTAYLILLLASLFFYRDKAYSATGTIGVVGDVASYTAGLSANGIASSRHNLGDFGRVLRTASRSFLVGDPMAPTILTIGTGTTQICVFCHTPHHANTDPGSPPLWNRVNTPPSYTAYGTTVAGTAVANVGGPSLACLSCHDGVTTFDTLINAPGKGGVNPGGLNYNYFWAMPGDDIWSAQQTRDHFDAAGSCNLCHAKSFITSLTIGTDLSNDHPVSVPYSGSSKASLRPRSTLISTINLSAGLTSTTGVTEAYLTDNLSQNRWAVSGFLSNTATIGDLLRNDKVECSSCHDPHFRNLSWNEAEPTWFVDRTLIPKTWCSSGEDCSDGMFLRRVGGNTGSGVCRTCHNK